MSTERTTRYVTVLTPVKTRDTGYARCTAESDVLFFFNVNINNVTAALPFSACILQSAAGPADATNADL